MNQPGGDYRLASSSPYKNQGTDGKDPGADIDALEVALRGTGTTPPPPPAPAPAPPPSDHAPSVLLTSARTGSFYAIPATIRCEAEATDSDRTPVARVDFSGTERPRARASYPGELRP